jgi:hemerythrin superfamily protein
MTVDKKRASPLDAIALLTQDHKNVKKMFDEYEGLGENAIASKKELADTICGELVIHTRIEEEIFYPAVRAAIDDDELMDEADVEHAGAKDLIAQIQSMEPGDSHYDAMVKVLGEEIDHHVKEEQEEMFPQVRKSDLDLKALGAQLAARKAELRETSKVA